MERSFIERGFRMSTDNNNDRYHVTPEDVARFEAAAEQMEPLRELSDEEADRIFGSGLVFGVGSSLLQAMIAHGKREHERR